MNDSNPDAAAVTIREACKVLGGISHVTVYRLINSGELRSFRVGRRRLVSIDAIHDYIASAEKGAQAAA